MTDASVDLRVLFWVGQDSEDLRSKFTARQSASTDLLAKFGVSQWEDLFAKLIIRHSSSLDLHCDFVIRRTVTMEVPVRLVIRRTATLDLPCEFIARHNSSIGVENWIKVIINIVRTWGEVKATFKVRNSSSLNLSCEFISKQSDVANLHCDLTVRPSSSADLHARLIVRHSATVDLPAEFVVMHYRDLKCVIAWVNQIVGEPCEVVIVDDDIDSWINFYDCIDHGFVDRPTHENDAVVKFSGVDSFKINSDRVPHRFKEIKFGWRSTGPINTCECMIKQGFPSCCTSEPGGSIIHDWQGRIFIAAGLYWIFFGCETPGSIYYSTSADGESWGAEIVLPDELGYNSSTAEELAICFDGTYFHFVNTSGIGDDGGLVYRRGLPKSDGTFTWDPQQNISTFYSYFNPTIEIDSNGYPYIGYTYFAGGGGYQPYLLKSSRNDGIWATAPGYPMRLRLTLTGSSWRVKILKLNDGKMYVLYMYGPLAGQTYVFGKFYDGSSWGAEESWSSEVGTITSTNLYSAVAGRFWGAPDYDVILAVRNVAGPLIMAIRYPVYSDKEELVGYGLYSEYIRDSVPSDVLPILCLNNNSGYIELLAFWAGEPDANTIYWNRYDEELGWATSPKKLVEVSGTTLKNNYELCGMHAAENDLPIIYATSLSAPNALRTVILAL